LKIMTFRGFQMTQRMAKLAVWTDVLGRAGNNTPRASVACHATVGGAYPDNRRA
jgi:hypothetical protein